MGHDHTHDHAPRDYGRAFVIGIVLNVAFVAVEAAYGIAAQSVALVADAAHNLSDVLGLSLAWAAAALARRRPTRRRTYGYRKTTILAALGNAVLLLVAVGGIAWEAVGRLRDPRPTPGGTMIAVAAIGVTVNAVSALFFASGRKRDANVRGAFLHLAADAAVSLGVVVAGVIILATGWRWVDAVTSLLVSLVIVLGTWGLLKQSLNLALDAVPEGIDPEAVAAYLGGLPGVLGVHDLHIWAMSTTETALTAHLVMAGGACDPRFLGDAGNALHERFDIDHATLQVEAPEPPDPCPLGPESSASC